MIAVAILSDAELHALTRDPEAGFGALLTEKGNLPLQAVEVRTQITGLSASLELRQTFRNGQPIPLEATYVFPLPDRAAVTGFRFEIGTRRIDGVLQERGAAREQYEQAIVQGHRGAIAEEERPGVFTMRVGNLMPGESATVQLTLSLPIAFSDGEATFRFPLVVAPRYIPGSALGGEPVGDGVAPDTTAVPDASRISPPVMLPGFPNPVRLGIEVELDSAGLPLGAVRSSLHAVSESRTGGGVLLRVQPHERLDRDFVLRWSIADTAVRTGLAVRGDDEGGTFELTVVPPAGLSKQTKPRRVIFVLDRSGSMAGWKMVSARRAVARMVDTLTDRDEFSVFAFDDSVECPPAFTGQQLATATDRNRFRAIEFLATVDARGGTQMAQPLTQAVTQLQNQGAERDRALVLVTDGQVGNEDQILRALGQSLTGIRIFTVGIDTAVNEGFLRRFAAAGGGAMELVESEDRLDEVMDRFQRRIGTPALTHLALEPTGCEVISTSITPARIPDLFVGAPVVIRGRYRGTAGAITLRARDASGEAWSVSAAATPTGNSALSSQWARARLRDLEDRYVVTPSDALEKDIVATSLRFGVMCRFTAFVAVDRSAVVNPGGAVAKQTQAVELPQGWDSMGAQTKGGVVYGSTSDKSKAVSVNRMRGGPSRPSTGGVPAAPPPARPAPRAAVMASVAPLPPPAAAAPSGSLASSGGSGHIGNSSGAPTLSDVWSSPAPQANVDLAPYRARARELLDLLVRAGDAPTRRSALGMLIVKLTALIEDLRSVGAATGEVEPLATLLDSLTKLHLAAGAPAAFEDETEKVLLAFVDAAAPAEKKSRLAFWR